MQDYTELYRKSMHRDRSPQKIRRWCNPWDETQARLSHTQLNCVM